MSEEVTDLIKTRREKLVSIREKGVNPYPSKFQRDNFAQEILNSFVEEKPADVKIAGRIRTKRMMGKAAFINIEDSSGTIQVYARKDKLGDETYEIFKTIDIGDIIGIEGSTFLTKQGEITVKADKFVLLSKCIRPLPVVKEKDGKVFDEFADKELRYRQRYVDLIVNSEVRKDFIIRSKVVTGLRTFLTERDFIEVETPMMQAIAGGAAAKPFITHHNALDIKLYLRVAPELYLKRLLIGGFDKVFELNRNFRNEGISTKHNPEFTMLEIYQAYADYSDMMNLTEEMISGLAQNILGKMIIDYQGSQIDLTPPWDRISYTDIIKKYTEIDFSAVTTKEEAKDAAASVGVTIEEDLSLWKIADEVFSERVEENLIQPVFITDFPRELSPLSKSREDNPDYVERFEPYIAGREIGNAFSELNDPEEQRRRFEDQVKMREAGDEEAHMIDHDYINALEYGLPPAGGLGIGIDRLVMLFVDTASIKDTILFPLLRPDKQE